MNIDYTQVAKRFIELSGGKDKLNEEMDSKLSAINQKWNQDIDAIGRILRSHLFVEHFITECLIFFNPNLSHARDVRLSYSQKLKFIEGYSNEIRDLAPGIRRLNKIRNRLAHTLEATVSDEDTNVILGIASFRCLREESAKPDFASNDSLDVLEDFAKHVGCRLDSLADNDSLAKRFAIAIGELTVET